MLAFMSVFVTRWPFCLIFLSNMFLSSKPQTRSQNDATPGSFPRHHNRNSSLMRPVINSMFAPVFVPVLLLLTVIALPAVVLSSEGGELPHGTWNQLRGPGGSGVAIDCHPPVDLDASTLAWQADLPAGLSSPVLANNRLFLTGIENGRLVTLALHAESGQLSWRREVPEVPLETVHKANHPAASTPLVDARYVYVYFGSYGLLCYDHQGREIWKKPIPTPKTLYGMATSPIGYANCLILVLDDDANLPDSQLSQSRILAVDRASGETYWETARPFQRSSWTTPTLWKHSDGEDLVVLGSGAVVGYDPQTGQAKWYATGFSRETIAVPVVGNGNVYVSAAMLGGVSDEQPDPQSFWEAVMQFDANQDQKLQRDEMTGHFSFPIRPELPPEHPGYGIPLPEDAAKRQARLDGMFTWIDTDKDGFWTRDEFLARLSFQRAKPTLMAIRPGGEGDISETHVRWRLHRGIPEIPSPLWFENRIYLVCNGGLFTAVDATDGEVLYRQRLGAPGQYSASPVCADGRIYLASNRGIVSIIKAGDSLEIIRQHDLGEPIFVTPAIDRSTIYFRTETQLRAYRRPAAQSQAE